MRCKMCNIDVSENTKKCPLCSADTVDEAPVLKDVKTAYYPKVKYVKPKLPYNAITFIVWAVVSLVLFITDMTVNNGDLTLTLFAATTIPCIWSFLLRPMYTQYYYFGRYVVADTVFLSLWLTVVSGKIFASALPALSYMIPAVLTVSLAVFLIKSLVSKETSFRASPFVIMLGAISLVLGIISVLVSGAKFYLYLIPLVFTVVSLLILRALSPEKFKAELQARFHA